MGVSTILFEHVVTTAHHPPSYIVLGNISLYLPKLLFDRDH